ncbi:hypothetical protein Halru_2927 [Halovivax ruber XH-70]|uniref:Uncharacterized protein n=1 Tax=Halovivax ruber (strain DSM 18193 / JCM 13892 / XH-70) TaxID=797302 RepID=L0IHP1_HALRX|nr:hypothetical protein [Halovivax ruber]AGB17497.1 hypothetical protein Halru_2927 [Halovivax ruber XH-70]
MIELTALSPEVQAAVLVGAVLVEAIVLYGGYGLLERVAAPPVIKAIKST